MVKMKVQYIEGYGFGIKLLEVEKFKKQFSRKDLINNLEQILEQIYCEQQGLCK